MIEQVHSSLLKLRDVYRSAVKKQRLKKKLAEYNHRLKLNVPFKSLWEAKKQSDCDISEFFLYGFYNMSAAQRDEYITWTRRALLAQKVGDLDAPLTIPGNKVLFNTIFAEFMRREWANPSACTPEEFVGFLRRHGEVIVKPSDQNQGRGIYKYRFETEEGALELYREMRGRGGLVEQLVSQHPRMAQLNPNTLNTLRISTYTDTDEVHILAAALRTGIREGACTDNLHGGKGCACPVDIETGRIKAEAFDQDMTRYATHPLTGVRFEGFEVPLWPQVLDTVRAAARKAYGLPQCHWIGWDLAVLPDGVELIEGNWRQAVDLIQCCQGGLYHEMERLSEKI